MKKSRISVEIRNKYWQKDWDWLIRKPVIKLEKMKKMGGGGVICITIKDGVKKITVKLDNNWKLRSQEPNWKGCQNSGTYFDTIRDKIEKKLRKRWWNWIKIEYLKTKNQIEKNVKIQGLVFMQSSVKIERKKRK